MLISYIHISIRLTDTELEVLTTAAKICVVIAEYFFNLVTKFS